MVSEVFNWYHSSVPLVVSHYLTGIAPTFSLNPILCVYYICGCVCRSPFKNGPRDISCSRSLKIIEKAKLYSIFGIHVKKNSFVLLKCPIDLTYGSAKGNMEIWNRTWFSVLWLQFSFNSSDGHLTSTLVEVLRIELFHATCK